MPTVTFKKFYFGGHWTPGKESMSREASGSQVRKTSIWNDKLRHKAKDEYQYGTSYT